jgi:hypothetical protein
MSPESYGASLSLGVRSRFSDAEEFYEAMGGNNHCLRALADEVKREYCAGERYLASSADSHTKCRVLDAMCFDRVETLYHNIKSDVTFYRKLVT